MDASLLQNIARQYGAAAKQRVLGWKQLMGNNQGLSDAEKLTLVNDFFNQVTFVSDQQHWGKNDYWATPIELLASNGGDCEDFSIAKYFTLRALGVEDERMRITYVKALELNQAHMVLTYFKDNTSAPPADPLVLDNLIDEILPASRRKDLLPVYSFNGDGLWVAKERGRGQLLGKSVNISRWADLLLRFKPGNK